MVEGETPSLRTNIPKNQPRSCKYIRDTALKLTALASKLA